MHADYQARKRGEARALGILAARLARAVYHLWRRGEAFDETRFWQGQASAKGRVPAGSGA